MESPVHSLDPRTRLLFAVELFVLALVADSPLEVSIVSIVVVSLAIVAKIAKRLVRTMSFTAGFAVMILVINMLVGQPLVYSIVLAIRFIAIVGGTSLFFLTTSPDELEYVMKWFRLPQDMVFAFVTAVRFVPVLMLDATQIMDAQKSRGLEMQKGNFIKRIRNFIPVLVPLVVTAVIRSGELAEAMESRAYGAVKKPSSLYALRMRKRDWATGAISVMLLVVSLYYFLVIAPIG
ncbi:MAG: energy-coupling factor transporter transmembrane protein EcfT [Thaumarchaeota archaeon]|nr:energy-coupling factor transporter transmembrane protein EcfT [Nitrososphaerota archaeon]